MVHVRSGDMLRACEWVRIVVRVRGIGRGRIFRREAEGLGEKEWKGSELGL